jgi:hypothetical protein
VSTLSPYEMAARLGLDLPAELVDRYATELTAELGDPATVLGLDLPAFMASSVARMTAIKASEDRMTTLAQLAVVTAHGVTVPAEYAEEVVDVLAREAAHDRAMAPWRTEAGER